MPILDKFYTKEDVAKKCINYLYQNIQINSLDKFLEPSAGSGNFSNNIPNILALDIKPEGKDILQQDFLTWETNYNHWITIGNPPFGHRCKLAIDFINKASNFSDVIAFVLPVSFMKWSVQSNISKNLKLIKNYYLPENSFTADGVDYLIRTVFQIWVKKDSNKDNNFTDLRLLSSPPTSHPDFDIWQYNATKEALSSIENDWSIATYRQGHHDYNKIFTRNDYDEIYKAMTRDKKKQQFFFIKPKTEEAKNIIELMDFNSLAERNMITPGFGKGDFVSYYLELKNHKFDK